MTRHSLTPLGLFEDNVLPDSLRWAAKVSLLTLAMALGVVVNQLKATCIAVILLFAFWQGIRPYWRFAVELRVDRCRCREEFTELQTAGIELIEEFPESFVGADFSDSGTVLRMVQAIAVAKGRTSKADAIDGILELEAERWHEKLAGVNGAVEQVVQCGLLGSLIGITAALAAGTNVDEIAAGMSTMTSTTVVGIGASLCLWGFAAIGNRSVDRHLAELRKIGNLLGGQDGPDGLNPTSGKGPNGGGGEPFVSLFGGHRHATQDVEA